MKNEPNTFYAEVSVRQAGYRWKNLRGDRLGELVYADEPDAEEVERASSSTKNLFRTYNPFEEEAALFRIFAELDPLEAVFGTQDSTDQAHEDQLTEFKQALCDFANRYGLPVTADLPGFSSGRATGRALCGAILEMRLALALWESVKRKDRRAISSIAHRDRKLGWRVDFMGYEFTPVSRVEQQFMQAMGSNRNRPNRSGDELELAMEILEFLIGARTDPKIEFHQSRCGILALCMRAEDLLSAMWLQLAMAVVENKQYRRCELCGKPFEVQRQRGGRQGRRDKRFCTTSCREISYQRRRAHARRMRAEGEHLRVIATTVETDLQTVKRWVGEE